MPEDCRDLLKAGDAFAKSGKIPDAVACYLQAAEIYSRGGFALKAVALYKQILQLDPGRMDVSSWLADSYAQLGLIADAIKELELANAHLELSGQKSARIAVLSRLLELAPDHPARATLAELTRASPFR